MAPDLLIHSDSNPTTSLFHMLTTLELHSASLTLLTNFHFSRHESFQNKHTVLLPRPNQAVLKEKP